MKISFDAKRIFHNFRGLGNYSRTLVSGLNKFYPENKYHLYSPELKDERAIEWKESHPDLIVETPKFFIAKKFSSFWRSLFLSLRLSKDSPDIYHGLSHEIPPFIKFTSIKTAVTIHDLIFLRFPHFFPWIDRIVYKKKFSGSCRNADIVIAICEQTKRDLIEFLNVPEEKIVVSYQSCNPLFYSLLPESKRNEVLEKYEINYEYLFYVGAIEERKNVKSILEAYIKSKAFNNVKLVLVGNGGQYKREIIDRVNELKLNDKVIFLSNVPNEDLPALYQSSKSFIFPSFFEGFGIPIIEALFSGTPVITSKGSCFPESGGPGSIYIDPNSIDELVTAIDSVSFDEDLRRNMISTGIEYVQKFKIENTTNDIMSIYEQLLNS